MKQLTIFVVLACLIQVPCAVARNLNEVVSVARSISRTNSPLDCSQYSNDYEILASFPFIVYLNPLSTSTSKTYGLMDANDNIYILYIANQRFVPSTVFCLKSLQQLHVRSTSFHEFELDDDSVRRLPAQIELLASSLTYLAIYDTMVTHLPEQIGKLTRLNRLELSNVGLIALPDAIGNLSSLSYLRLSNNKLTSLPVTMASMRSLFRILLDNNPRLRSVQPLNGLPNLSSLYIQNCLVERLPINLSNLLNLYMVNNNLTDLVNIRTLGNNTNSLKYFLFDMNRIRSVPPQIRFVRNLYQLGLNHNELSDLPSDIFNVTSLRSLDIRNNLFSGTELRAIVTKFNATNPTLSLSYLSAKESSIKSS